MYQRGKPYIRGFLGLLTLEGLAELEKTIAENDAEIPPHALAYNCVCPYRNATGWSFKLRLNPDFTLPNIGYLEQFLAEEVEDSMFLGLSGNFRGYASFAERLRSLYDFLKSSDAVSSLYDDSKSLLMGRAAEAVKNLVEDIITKRIKEQEKLTRISIEEGLEAHMKGKPEGLHSINELLDTLEGKKQSK